MKDAESVNGGADKPKGHESPPSHDTGGRSRGKATAHLREAISFHKAIRPSRGALRRGTPRSGETLSIRSPHLFLPVAPHNGVSLRLESKTEEATFPVPTSESRDGRVGHSLGAGVPPRRANLFQPLFLSLGKAVAPAASG